LGLDPAFRVKPDGEGLCCRVARDRIGLEPVLRRPLEGLARNNRTGACIAFAPLAALRLRSLLVVGFRVQALMLQALQATTRSFRPRLHSVKPHPGQVFVAGLFRPLPEGSALVRDEGGGARG
jgi:histidine ammonia-lyase